MFPVVIIYLEKEIVYFDSFCRIEKKRYLNWLHAYFCMKCDDLGFTSFSVPRDFIWITQSWTIGIAHVLPQFPLTESEEELDY